VGVVVSDHKFERQTDRNITTLDAKQRLIDLMANPFVLPDEDIYDEPVRYYKLNLRWAPIIFGWLDWLEDIAGWVEAEDESFSGIQQVLKFEEGIEPVATEAELTNAIYNGMYKWTNDVAKQIISGRITDIAVDEDGNIVAPSEGGALPGDDPLTPQDESKMAKSGGAIRVRIGINDLLLDVHTLYGNDAVEDTTLSDALFIISSRYKVDITALTTVMTEYWADRAASKVQLTTIDTNLLDSELYCEGVSKQTINSVIVDITAVSIEARQNAVGLVNALTDEQISDWFNIGSETGSTNYLAYSCEPIPDYEFTIQWGAASINDTHIFKKHHRYLITVEGSLLDPDGDIQDAWWHKQVGQIEVFDNADFNIQQGGAVKIDPTVFEVPYNVQHKYVWTLDMGDQDASPQWTLSRDGTMAVGSTSPSNGLLVKVHDLGEIF